MEIRTAIWDSLLSRFVWPSEKTDGVQGAAVAFAGTAEPEGSSVGAPAGASNDPGASPLTCLTRPSFDFVFYATLHLADFKHTDSWPSVEEIIEYDQEEFYQSKLTGPCLVRKLGCIKGRYYQRLVATNVATSFHRHPHHAPSLARG